MFHRLGIETDEMAFLAKDGSELVHDATLHTHIIVFGALTDAGQLKLVDAQLQQVVQCKGVSAFECGRRGHPGTQGHIARECGVERFHAATPLDDFTANAKRNFAHPSLGDPPH